MTSQRFHNKVAIITGAGSGIGAATAKIFSKQGASLVLADINEETLGKVVQECTKNGSTVLGIRADITVEADLERVIEKTLKSFPSLDILVNNAGIIGVGSIETTTLAQYDKIMNINVRAAYYLTMLAVPHLIKSKGCIVNVSSVAGLRSIAGSLTYNMSKSAMDQFTKSSALELGPKQVRVNSVNPGLIDTNLYTAAGISEQQLAQGKKATVRTTALGRPGKAEDVAIVIAFLASNDAAYITAVNLPVDGGRQAMCPRE